MEVSPRRCAGGFSLIELMVSITLGILLSIGLVVLFGATSKTNRVQEGMAQMQENGRYAISRMNADLRSAMHQTLSVSGYIPTAPGATTPDGVVNSTIAPDVYVATLPLPDNGGNLAAPSTADGWLANWPAGKLPWPLSPRFFIQGYECSSGTCLTPDVPVGSSASRVGPPASGTTATSRVQGADVLTLRYLNSDGWSLAKGELRARCTPTGIITDITVTPLVPPAAPAAPLSPPLNFQAGDLAMLVVGSTAEIFPANFAGNAVSGVLTPPGAIPNCPSSPAMDATLYNFSADFITVTYYLKLNTDTNPDAVAGRLIPVLVRRQSDNRPANPPVEQEIVQGVERLDFLYGLEQENVSGDSLVSYLNADQVNTASVGNCPPAPGQFATMGPGTAEPGCLWRALKSIEVHALVDSVNNMYDLSIPDTAFQYQGSTTVAGVGDFDPIVAPAPAPPAGSNFPVSNLAVGKMMRREFVSLVSVRNYNP